MTYVTRTAAGLLCCLAALTAQDRPSQSQTFRAQTKVVQVPVVVTGKDGANVNDLTAQDFRVLDNGVAQQVTMDDFISGLAPLSLAIAIQSSGTSKLALAKIRHEFAAKKRQRRQRTGEQNQRGSDD